MAVLAEKVTQLSSQTAEIPVLARSCGEKTSKTVTALLSPFLLSSPQSLLPFRSVVGTLIILWVPWKHQASADLRFVYMADTIQVFGDFLFLFQGELIYGMFAVSFPSELVQFGAEFYV